MTHPLLESRLGKYEYTALISARAQQLANNAPTTLTSIPDGCTSAIEIALSEFSEGRLPIKIKRRMLNGDEVVKKLDELNFYG